MSQATASPVSATGPHRQLAESVPRLLPPPGDGRNDLGTHLERHGPVPYRGAALALIGEVKAAGLTGRGGASFPTYRKLEAVAAAGSGHAIVVGNGAESEPASHKDEALLRLAPHLVLDGLQLAAEAVGARRVVLYVRRDLVLRPHVRGGGQELNRRPGTENVAAIAGLGAAAAAARRNLAERGARVAELRDLMEREVLRRVPGSSVNGGASPRIPNTSSLAFDGVAAEALVFALDLEGIAVSSGAACSAGTIRRSHVLLAMGLVDEAGASIRVSLGPSNTREQIATFVETLERMVERARSAAPRAAGRGLG